MATDREKLREEAIQSIKDSNAPESTKAKWLQDEVLIEKAIKSRKYREARKQSELDTDKAWEDAIKLGGIHNNSPDS